MVAAKSNGLKIKGCDCENASLANTVAAGSVTSLYVAKTDLTYLFLHPFSFGLLPRHQTRYHRRDYLLPILF